MAGEVVRIINNSDRDFDGMYANQKYSIPSGREAIVPSEAMWLWLGHPEAVNLGPNRNYRHEEYERLRVRYGAFDERDRDDNTITPADEKWEQNKPLIEAWDLEGNRIVTVVDDPEGKDKTPATSSIAQQDLLVQQMEAMERRMKAMQDQLAAAQRGEQSEAVSDAAKDKGPQPDAPKTRPVGDAPLAGPSDDVPPILPTEDVAEDKPTRVRVGS